MHKGNWVPVRKGFVKFLPKNRPYTELEAVFCLQLDCDENKTATVSGYANLWQWSRHRVRKFLDMVGVSIEYKKDSRKYRNQSGHIVIHKTDISEARNGHIKICDSSNLQSKADISNTKCGHKTDISRSTTRYPNPNPKIIMSENSDEPPQKTGQKTYPEWFETFWKSYPPLRRQKKKSCFKKLSRHLKDGLSIDDLMAGLAAWKKSQNWTNDNGQYIHSPETWINNEMWAEDPPVVSNEGNLGKPDVPAYQLL